MFVDKLKSASLPDLSDRELALYERHFDLLRKWNENIGLVSRKSIDRAFAIHYADSIHIAHLARSSVNRALVDVGSGAGFPGLVFAIRYPEVTVTLYEKQLKKQMFLTAALAALELPNVTIGGLLPDKKTSGVFLSRAFLPRPELFPFFRRRLQSDSLLITCLGGTPREEALPSGFQLTQTHRYTLPAPEGDRQVQIYRRVPRET